MSSIACLKAHRAPDLHIGRLFFPFLFASWWANQNLQIPRFALSCAIKLCGTSTTGSVHSPPDTATLDKAPDMEILNSVSAKKVLVRWGRTERPHLCELSQHAWDMIQWFIEFRVETTALHDTGWNQILVAKLLPMRGASDIEKYFWLQHLESKI